MSVAYLRQKSKVDPSLGFPRLAEQAKQLGRNVTVVGMRSLRTQPLSIFEIALLHVNSANEVRWTHDWIKPPLLTPALLHSQRLQPEWFDDKHGWNDFWKSGFRHFLYNHAVVFTSPDEVQCMQEHQGMDPSNAPWPFVMTLRDMAGQDPQMPWAIARMAQHYQISWPEEHEHTAKSRAYGAAAICDQMLREHLPQWHPEAHHGDTATRTTKVPDAERVAATIHGCALRANTASEFFALVAEHTPLHVHGFLGKVQGYSVKIPGSGWKKGSELNPRLAYSQLARECGWLSEPNPEAHRTLIARYSGDSAGS